MDPNLVAQLLANDPNTTNSQPTNAAPQQPYAPPTNPQQPQNPVALQSPAPAPSSPNPSNTSNNNNQLIPPRRNKYNDAFNPRRNNPNTSLNLYQNPIPRYYPDSDSGSESDDNDGHSFFGIHINSNNGNNYGNSYGPIYGSGFGMQGWSNGNMTIINGRDWSGIPQSQWPASVRSNYEQGMAAGARAMEEAADLLNGLGLGMGMGMGPWGIGMGMGGTRRR